MPNIAKLIEKMKNQPHGIRFDEASKVLAYYGYEAIRIKGSHRHFRHGSGDLITIKYSNPIPKVYIADILERIGE